MVMKVRVQLHNGQQATYENAIRIDETDHCKIKIYGQETILAIIDKGDLKNLLTEEIPLERKG